MNTKTQNPIEHLTKDEATEIIKETVTNALKGIEDLKESLEKDVMKQLIVYIDNKFKAMRVAEAAAANTYKEDKKIEEAIELLDKAKSKLVVQVEKNWYVKKEEEIERSL